jgi:hypothetical protein
MDDVQTLVSEKVLEKDENQTLVLVTLVLEKDENQTLVLEKDENQTLVLLDERIPVAFLQDKKIKRKNDITTRIYYKTKWISTICGTKPIQRNYLMHVNHVEIVQILEQYLLHSKCMKIKLNGGFGNHTYMISSTIGTTTRMDLIHTRF